MKKCIVFILSDIITTKRSQLTKHVSQKACCLGDVKGGWQENERETGTYSTVHTIFYTKSVSSIYTSSLPQHFYVFISYFLFVCSFSPQKPFSQVLVNGSCYFPFSFCQYFLIPTVARKCLLNTPVPFVQRRNAKNICEKNMFLGQFLSQCNQFSKLS